MECAACRGRRFEVAFNSARGRVARCFACGLFFLQEAAVGERQAEGFYDTIDPDVYIPYFEPMRKAHYRSVLGKLSLSSGAKHLDVGASYGWMVEVGLEFGLDSYGIEPGAAEIKSPLAAKRINRATVETFAQEELARFDVITLWHVLEHLRDPMIVIGSLRSLLAEDGRLVIAIPNAEGNLYRTGLLLCQRFGISRLMDELYYFHNPNPHFFYYTPQALHRLLESAGLQVEQMFTMEAFDWASIYKRISRPFPRGAARLLGPVVAASNFTAHENLIAVANRA